MLAGCTLFADADAVDVPDPLDSGADVAADTGEDLASDPVDDPAFDTRDTHDEDPDMHEPDMRPDVGPECALLDNRCNREDDDCNGQVDELCCPSANDEWFTTGPAPREEHNVHPTVAWAGFPQQYLVTWIRTDERRDSGSLSRPHAGTLRVAQFDLRSRPVGSAGMFVDENVLYVDSVASSTGFSVVYVHNNPGNEGPRHTLSVVHYNFQGDELSRGRVSETDGLFTGVTASEPEGDSFLVAWVEESDGAHCPTQGSSCVKTTSVRVGSGVLAEPRVVEESDVGFLGVDSAYRNGQGILTTIRLGSGQNTADLVAWPFGNQFIAGPGAYHPIDGSELQDTSVDPAPRINARSDGGFVVVRTASGETPRVVAHRLESSGVHQGTSFLAEGDLELRDVVSATVGDPQLSAFTAFANASGIQFRLWDTTMQQPLRSAVFAPGGDAPPLFDHRPVAVATAPQAGYIVAVSGPRENAGTEIYHAFIGPEVDILCAPP